MSHKNNTFLLIIRCVLAEKEREIEGEYIWNMLYQHHMYQPPYYALRNSEMEAKIFVDS